MRRFTFFWIIDFPDGTTDEEIQEKYNEVVLPDDVTPIISSGGTAEHYPGVP